MAKVARQKSLSDLEEITGNPLITKTLVLSGHDIDLYGICELDSTQQQMESVS